ncbi:unnamed protein product [Litomosoides sigmodontis]|uniref:Uncharacterized protein n=1 Tax=Litomosoides sigmodontis TaxID=42156 RepID=A0A3P6V2P7_LITSI|nr:unnamed protein product [Litomosoides sigmodontis]
MENVGSDNAVSIGGTTLRLSEPPRSLWESSSRGQSSCYGSLTASTSSACAPAIAQRRKLSNTPAYEKLTKSDSTTSIEAPKFHYDMDFDLRALKEALKSAEFLDESGYQSVLERSQHNQYGTGWIIHRDMSEVSSDTDDNWGKQRFITEIAVL